MAELCLLERSARLRGAVQEGETEPVQLALLIVGVCDPRLVDAVTRYLPDVTPWRLDGDHFAPVPIEHRAMPPDAPPDRDADSPATISRDEIEMLLGGDAPEDPLP